MATLERIRQRSGLLLTIIGLAMLAFILTDLLGSGNSMFRGDARIVGRVDGHSIEINEFSTRMDEYQKLIAANNPQQANNISRKQLADGVWDQILREQILEAQYNELGLSVSSTELYNRLKNNPNIQGAPAFRDQTTGAFSEVLFQQYVSSIRDNSTLDPQMAEAYTQWVDFEKGVKEQAQTLKYNKAIEKGLYYPEKLAGLKYLSQNANTSAQFIALEYSSITEDEIEVTEADYKAYYEENKESYKSEDNMANIEYVSFNIQPSEKDKNDVVSELNSYLNNTTGDSTDNFRLTTDDSTFAANRSDLIVRPDFYKADNLPSGLDSSFFAQETGYIYGPYENNGYYNLTKIIDRKAIPDSVNARHILISFQGAANGQSEATRTYEEAKALADSLLNVVKNDTSTFADIAKSTSEDPGSGAKGGDLDWFAYRTMVKPFNDFCFLNNVGDIAVVPSQFGFHIIEILGHKGTSDAVKIVNISREFAPSDETYDIIYDQASAYASEVSDIESFSAKAEEKGYTPRPATRLKSFDENISGLGANRDIIKWAHNEETNIGDIQLFNNNNNAFVVVILTQRTEKGYAALESIKDLIKPAVVNRVKAEKLTAKINDALNGASTLAEVAKNLGVEVKDQVTSFNGSAITNYGSEPKVVGTMTGLKPNTLSKPIAGNRGVYVIEVKEHVNLDGLQNYKAQQEQEISNIRPRVSSQVFLSLKDGAKIDDRRANFY